MKIFEKFLGKKEEPKKEVEIVDLSRIDSFINKERDKNLSSLGGECEEMIKSAFDSIEKIKAIVLKMEGDVIVGPEVHVKIKKIIVNDKPFFVKGVLNAASSLSREDMDFGSDLGKINAIAAELTKTAQTIANTDLRYGRFLHLAVEMMAFRKELKSLVKKVAELNQKASKIPKNSSLDKIKSMSKEFESELRIEKDLRKKLSVEKEKEESSRKRLSDLMESGESADFKITEEEYNKIIKDTGNISSAVYGEISPLLRILRKIKKSDEKDSKVIDAYIENPRVFFERDSNEIISILNKSKEAPLEEHEKSKVLKFMEGFHELERMKSDYLKLKDSENKIFSKKESSKIPAKKNEIEHEINALNESMAQTEKEIARMLNKRMKTIQEIESLKEKIEAEYENKVKINIDSIKINEINEY